MSLKKRATRCGDRDLSVALFDVQPTERRIERIAGREIAGTAGTGFSVDRHRRLNLHLRGNISRLFVCRDISEFPMDIQLIDQPIETISTDALVFVAFEKETPAPPLEESEPGNAIGSGIAPDSAAQPHPLQDDE